MNILVTAFSPFDGRVENASALALQGLKDAFPGIRTRILPVDSVIAPVRLKQALWRLRPDVLVMLGEAAGSRSIRLEEHSWNELDFKIPDNAGFQPSCRPIRAGASLVLHGTLPFKRLHERLVDAGHDVVLSTDPGRYLCNQVFYTALDYLGKRGASCQAGFIHLPLAGVLPTPRAIAALSCVIDCLDGQNRK